MAEHKTTANIVIPEECKEPLAELEIFFRTNAYKTVSQEDEKIVFERGTKGKGFWTSDVTVLPTTLEIELVGELAIARYDVTTTGQLLNDDERGYWKREAAAAATFLDTGQAANMVEEERFRAEKLRGEFARKGVFIGTIVSIVMFIALVLLLK